VGLTPVVVHGGGPQLTEELASRGVETEFVDGLRVTTPEILRAAQRGVPAHGRGSSRTRSTRAGCGPGPLPSGVFGRRGRRGTSSGTWARSSVWRLDAIVRAAERGQIPVLSPIGHVG
jgi:acetylglutamate kinase